MDAPEVERNFNTVRRIRRVMTKSEAKGRKVNMPRDLQVIAEKLIDTVRDKLKAHEGPKDHPLKELSRVHNELNIVESDAGELLYKGDKIVPPKSARQELLKLAHTTHLGEEIIWNNMKRI